MNRRLSVIVMLERFEALRLSEPLPASWGRISCTTVQELNNTSELVHPDDPGSPYSPRSPLSSPRDTDSNNMNLEHPHDTGMRLINTANRDGVYAFCHQCGFHAPHPRTENEWWVHYWGMHFCCNMCCRTYIREREDAASRLRRWWRFENARLRLR